jgi:hypothetical protein
MRRLAAMICLVAGMAAGLDVDLGSLSNEYEWTHTGGGSWVLSWITEAPVEPLVLEYLFATDATPVLDTSGSDNHGTKGTPPAAPTHVALANSISAHMTFDTTPDTITSTVTQDKVTFSFWAKTNSTAWRFYERIDGTNYCDDVAASWSTSTFYSVSGNVITWGGTGGHSMDAIRVDSEAVDRTNRFEQAYGGNTNGYGYPAYLYNDPDGQRTNCVLWPTCQEDQDIVQDWSGEGAHGDRSASGTTFQSGGDGTAWLDYDGSSGYTDITGVSDATTEMTFAAWINPGDVSGYQTIIDNARQYRVRLNDANLQFAIPNVAAATASTGTISADEWTHVAIVWDRDGNTIDYYINGSHDSQVAFSAEPTVTGAAAIGAQGGGGINLNGGIDDPAIFTTGFASNEVFNVYTNGPYYAP